jgi:hypothetical protein
VRNVGRHHAGLHRAIGRHTPALLATAAVLALAVAGLSGQTHGIVSPPADPGTRNMDRVAASSDQLRAVLRDNAGLMVEVKRLVAQEATNRGQLVEDRSLTDAGVFDRLQRDMAFSAVVTRLVQRYGYLTPQVNPDSPLARDEEWLREARLQQLRADRRDHPDDGPGRLTVPQERTAASGAPAPAASPLPPARLALPEASFQDVPGTPAGLPVAGAGVAQASLTTSPGTAAMPLFLDARDAVNADRNGTVPAGEITELRRLSPASEPGAQREAAGASAPVPGTPGVRPNPFADVPVTLRPLPAGTGRRTRRLLRDSVSTIFHHGTRDRATAPDGSPCRARLRRRSRRRAGGRCLGQRVAAPAPRGRSRRAPGAARGGAACS